MTLAFIHERLANTALLYIGILLLWGIWRFIRRQGVDSNYRGALAVAEVLILAQGVLGLFMYFSGKGVLERPSIHILYGVVGALVIPGVFLFTREDEQRLSVLVYVALLTFLLGILIRSLVTGG